VVVSDSYAGSDVGPVDFINSVIDGAGAGSFACVAGSDVGPVDFINSVIDGAGAFACVVEEVLLELLAGVVVVFPLLPPILTVAGFDDDPSRTITYHLLLSF